ncbi:class I SAM-dependent methyltransferase [Ekhidna sp.]|uniref:class I SAM-dependent methyltransferase n=1 Tax=Ekhidna sp. TaxID=2608089 RepID=UPI003B50E826
MYEKLEACPICKNTQFQNHIICDDHSVSKESFALVECTKCNLVFTNPRPEEKHLHKYYNSDNYISHTDKANNLINLIYKLVRKYTLRQKLSLVNSLTKKSKLLLDYGCGTGDFIKLCNQNKWQAFGYEPDDIARSIAQSKNNTIIERLSEIKQPVDIITAWHVIEHVSDLSQTIKSLKKKLKDGGHMILALPNHKSYDSEYYKEYWAGYDVPRHLYHFDQESLSNLASKHKLKLVKVHPQKFDSYYVSLLSEKYKGHHGFMNALKIGYKSNQKAKNNNQYSSLIYILRK